MWMLHLLVSRTHYVPDAWVLPDLLLSLLSERPEPTSCDASVACVSRLVGMFAGHSPGQKSWWAVEANLGGIARRRLDERTFVSGWSAMFELERGKRQLRHSLSSRSTRDTSTCQAI